MSFWRYYSDFSTELASLLWMLPRMHSLMMTKCHFKLHTCRINYFKSHRSHPVLRIGDSFSLIIGGNNKNSAANQTTDVICSLTLDTHFCIWTACPCECIFREKICYAVMKNMWTLPLKGLIWQIDYDRIGALSCKQRAGEGPVKAA